MARCSDFTKRPSIPSMMACKRWPRMNSMIQSLRKVDCLPQMLLPQVAERLHDWFGLILGVQEAAVGEDVSASVGELSPLDAADRGFAEREGDEGGGPLGLSFGIEARVPATRRHFHFLIRLGIRPARRRIAHRDPQGYSQDRIQVNHSRNADQVATIAAA